MYELKPLFMSAESKGLPGAIDPDPAPSTEAPPETQEGEPRMEEEEKMLGMEDEEEDWSEEGKGKDCVVCQNAPVNRLCVCVTAVSIASNTAPYAELSY
ncbi:hypothetical protein J4Q44_G00346190 [Coregonus suidteri]|uniref:Uncharacterized protein n=1 Tax=Coregonus suidteri TaxID=861788 RepID=A0AAN8KQ47_9TELE